MAIELLICSYSYHTHPFQSGETVISHYLFRLQTEGTSRVELDGQSIQMSPGDLLLCAPGQRYSLTVEPVGDSPVRSGDYYIFCLGEWLDQWWQRSPKPACIRIQHEEPAEPIIFLWKQLALESRRLDNKESELVDSLMRNICLYIDRSIEERVSVPREMFIANRMKRYIENHATELIRTENIARHVQLSASRASHLFKEIFGESFFQYALHVRLSIATEKMIYSGLSLEQIAESSGLRSYAFFHRKFKEKYGISPGQFRRQHHSR